MYQIMSKCTYNQHRSPEVTQNNSHNHETCRQNNGNCSHKMLPKPNVLLPEYERNATWVIRQTSFFKFFTQGTNTLQKGNFTLAEEKLKTSNAPDVLKYTLMGL